MSPRCQQADFSVASRPEAQGVKPALGLAVFLQPDESNAFVIEPPYLDEAQDLGEMGKVAHKKARCPGPPNQPQGACITRQSPLWGSVFPPPLAGPFGRTALFLYSIIYIGW